MKPNLYLFIGLSLLIHVIVASGFIWPQDSFKINEQGRSNISVEISPSETQEHLNKSTSNLNTHQPENLVATSTHSTSNSTHKHTQTEKTNKNIQNLKKRKTNTQKRQELTKEKSSNLTMKTEASKVSPNINKIESIIKAELSRYFYYPSSAQRKNWQGLVIISFLIKADGNITEIRINKSSGYNVLDTAAIDALSKVKRKEELSLALNGNTISQLLPVTYQLTN